MPKQTGHVCLINHILVHPTPGRLKKLIDAHQQHGQRDECQVSPDVMLRLSCRKTRKKRRKENDKGNVRQMGLQSEHTHGPVGLSEIHSLKKNEVDE